jgi:voltage-gated potassium channel
MKPSHEEPQTVEAERNALLAQVSSALEIPMIILGFAWIALLVVEFAVGFTRTLELLFYMIWGVFILHFLLEFLIAPKKLAYLRRSWLTGLSLFIPALRVLRAAQGIRLLRLARTVRGVRLARVLTTLRRGMRSLGAVMSRRGFGYVVLLTVLVIFGGAAGMYGFEGGAPGFENFGRALWWTAMIVTTMGSGEWPQSPEGMMLSLILSIYSFAIFGYVAATIASFFIDSDAGNDKSALAGAQSIRDLKEEIASLRRELGK